MYVLFVTVHVELESVDDFLASTREHASQTRQEQGNVRYDLLQNDEDPACFVIYEAYKSKEDFWFHRDAAHSTQWKKKIEPWMSRPRQRIRCTSILFGDD